MDAETYVTNGVALLEEHRPNWDSLVNLDALDISSTRNCVLGQVFASEGNGSESGFGTGMQLLSIGGGKSAKFGFAPSRDVSGVELRREWVRVISERIGSSELRDRQGVRTDEVQTLAVA